MSSNAASMNAGCWCNGDYYNHVKIKNAVRKVEMAFLSDTTCFFLKKVLERDERLMDDNDMGNT